jgi:hypothetical protein
MTKRSVRLGVAVLAAAIAGGASPAGATLAGDLSRFIARQGAVLTQTQFPDTITPVITRLAAQATDFPVPPTTPGYVFVYNPQQGIFERYQGSLGPVFLERVDTLGQNHFAVGVSYLYGNPNQFDGEDFLQGVRTPVGGAFADPGSGAQFNGGVFLSDFELPTNKINFAGSYGITDQWDVGFLVPLVWTNLRVKGRPYLANGPLPPSSCPSSGACAVGPTASLDQTSVGVGDLLLRTKYRFGYLADWGFAGGLVLRVPTGDADNFHGLGDVTLEPQLIISRAFGVQDVHANLGMEFNAANSTRTRARYGIGATLSLPSLPQLALLLDFVGWSQLDDETFNTTARFSPNVDPLGVIAPFVTSQSLNPDGSFTITSTLPRADQFNAAVGLKFEIWQNLLGWATAVVPLTRQGLQADVISAVGLEYSY